MNKLLALLAFIPCLVFANPSHLSISQQRAPNETMEQVVKRFSKILPQSAWTKESPFNKKVPLMDMDYSLAPKITTYAELLAMFHFVRDTRFLYEEAQPGFGRRISWLYPDDGCFARAAMTGMSLQMQHFIRPAKIFAFGELSLKTPYSVKGEVFWWYHVAAVVNYMDSIYVLDPALKPDGPILVGDWYNKMGIENDLTGVVCNPYTYDPFDYCYKISSKGDINARKDQSRYLEKEWSRMQSLGFDPLQILGNNPPWN
ncbi:protein-glutamine glutaminase family protein [Legionella sp. km772]|uniref:protein-glutamine glutaminase family protein n=1 Tax=Legionella sp. km772 TaxID=2498111 RepID=UPI000F8E24BB|nr:protein-glutamine glutaminase family protein [Legionella sp. km772]RUR05694.1 hypothetical protein ELY15_14010 [Legionella sp. km772]